MSPAIVGIPAYSAHDGREYAMAGSYCQAIRTAGGVPLLLPPVDEPALRRLYALLDGLLLAGGGDVAAEHYGGPDSDLVRGIDRERDRVELQLSRWALADGLPLLGICRGIQTLNVAAGGTLVQDIPSALPTALVHSTPATQPRDSIAHPVCVQPHSLLAQALGLVDGDLSHVPVNSWHHQAVLCPAAGFAVTARAPDGVIEAIEPEAGSAWVLGVQWHPENMVDSAPAMLHLFTAFVQACERGRQGAQ